MSWIADLLKDIPLSVVLKEKISLVELKFAESEKKVAILESENADLTARLLETQKENDILKSQLRINAENENLGENALQILRLLAQNDSRLTIQKLEMVLELPRVEVQYSIDNLLKHRYLQGYRPNSIRDAPRYGLSKEGRSFVIENLR